MKDHREKSFFRNVWQIDQIQEKCLSSLLILNDSFILETII